ncbi:unnamed protein product, partial [Amoebophrya sp. A25]
YQASRSADLQRFARFLLKKKIQLDKVLSIACEARDDHDTQSSLTSVVVPVNFEEIFLQRRGDA